MGEHHTTILKRDQVANGLDLWCRRWVDFQHGARVDQHKAWQHYRAFLKSYARDKINSGVRPADRSVWRRHLLERGVIQRASGGTRWLYHIGLRERALGGDA